MTQQDNIEQAIQRAIDNGSMLYNRKDNCPDNQRDRELRWIYRLAEIAPYGLAVECGIGTGGTMLCWSMVREDKGEIIAIDIKAPENFGEFDRLYEMPSIEAAQLIENKIAFCFIDADHTEAGIKADVDVWPDKMIPGGVLAFHDYGSPHELAIKKVVDKWQDVAKWELLGQVGSLIAFRKPEDGPIT